MPLFKSKSTEKRPLNEKEPLPAAVQAAPNSNTNGTNGTNGNGNGHVHAEPLPVYSVEGRNVTDAEASAAAAAAAATVDVGPLNLPASPVELSADSCLAHLRLLYALQALKEDVGYNDGLFGLSDSIASNADLRLPDVKDQKQPEDEQQRIKARLALVREKRWGLFVARAADRYAAWWDKLCVPKTPITEQDMDYPSQPKFTDFPTASKPMEWTIEMLPPLDVLMVLHAHMLNPRDFLEDCMRHGMPGLWAAGFPWALVNACISSGGEFDYDVPEATKVNWKQKHGLEWENANDSPNKTLECPACQQPVNVPWTTVPDTIDRQDGDELTRKLNGLGYGDAGFAVTCQACLLAITPEVLSVNKFRKDASNLLTKNVPMPGTVLELSTGTPAAYTNSVLPEGRTLPNRIIKHGLAVWSLTLLDSKTGRKNEPAPTMELVRVEIEKIFEDKSALAQILYGTHLNIRMRHAAPRASRMAVRKMMSRYWTNYSPFALDLVGAVLRQGVFSAKMHDIDWLHSPTARTTMDRLVTKYKRFIGLMADYPDKTCVPTLDVDLAWHTHQLSPLRYYAYTTQATGKATSISLPLKTKSVVTKGGKFIDHDDKIDEDQLHIYYEFTSRVYQQKHNEVYSECTCWYCEAVRASHVSSVGRVLGMSNNDQINEGFHNSNAKNGAACGATAAHISAHNAVSVSSSGPDAVVRASVRARQLQRLENNYQKAAKRAEKKGRQLPPRNEYYDHWGYSYYMYSPFMYPYYYTYGVGPYYGGDPGNVPMDSGGAGGCANGT